MKELSEGLSMGQKVWGWMAGWPLWAKVLAIVLFAAVGLAVLRGLQGEGGD